MQLVANDPGKSFTTPVLVTEFPVLSRDLSEVFNNWKTSVIKHCNKANTTKAVCDLETKARSGVVPDGFEALPSRHVHVQGDLAFHAGIDAARHDVRLRGHPLFEYVMGGTTFGLHRAPREGPHVVPLDGP